MEDQCVITRQVTVAAGVFAPGHLGELTQLVPFEMVDEALAQTRTVQRRMRDLPSRVVVYLLLAACLFPDLGYRAYGANWQRAWPACRWQPRRRARWRRRAAG